VRSGKGSGGSRFIAGRLGRAPSTISREVTANRGRERYRPHRAHDRADEGRRRPEVRKLEAIPRLWARAEADLRRLWSPQQVSNGLRTELGDDQTMWVSAETIY